MLAGAGGNLLKLNQSSNECAISFNSTEDIHRLRTTQVASVQSGFASQRRVLDLTHHAQYTQERTAFQDRLVQEAVSSVVFGTSSASSRPEQLAKPWLLFTAGPMGAGKSHVTTWLGEQHLLPLRPCVHVDPDVFRERLPEWPQLQATNPETAGALTKKEVGLLVELATEVAMAHGCHVWQDGSLRDAAFFKKRFGLIRRTWPQYRIALMYVTANEATIRRRTQQRAASSGRVVPNHELDQSLKRTPASFDLLAPLADVAFFVDNSNENGAPMLREVQTGQFIQAGHQLGGIDGLRGVFAEAERRPPLGQRMPMRVPHCWPLSEVDVGRSASNPSSFVALSELVASQGLRRGSRTKLLPAFSRL